MSRSAIVLLVSAVLAIGLGGIWYIGIFQGHREEDRAIEKVENSIRPGASWKLLERSAEPARLLCLGGNPCPSTFLRYETSDVSAEVLASTVPDADVSIPKDCMQTGRDVLCVARANQDGFEIMISVRHRNDKSFEVTYSIRPDSIM